MLSWLHGKILMNEFQNQKYRPARLPHKRLAGEIRLTAILALSLALWIGFLQAQHTLDRYEGFFFTLTLGCLLAGALVPFIGAPLTVMAGGLCCITGALVFVCKLKNLRRMIHPIYVRKGIIPEVAAGIQSASSSTQLP